MAFEERRNSDRLKEMDKVFELQRRLVKMLGKTSEIVEMYNDAIKIQRNMHKKLEELSE